jgi:hypothetical protein
MGEVIKREIKNISYLNDLRSDTRLKFALIIEATKEFVDLNLFEMITYDKKEELRRLFAQYLNFDINIKFTNPENMSFSVIINKEELNIEIK